MVRSTWDVKQQNKRIMLFFGLPFFGLKNETDFMIIFSSSRLSCIYIKPESNYTKLAIDKCAFFMRDPEVCYQVIRVMTCSVIMTSLNLEISHVATGKLSFCTFQRLTNVLIKLQGLPRLACTFCLHATKCFLARSKLL